MERAGASVHDNGGAPEDNRGSFGSDRQGRGNLRRKLVAGTAQPSVWEAMVNLEDGGRGFLAAEDSIGGNIIKPQTGVRRSKPWAQREAKNVAGWLTKKNQ